MGRVMRIIAVAVCAFCLVSIVALAETDEELKAKICESLDSYAAALETIEDVSTTVKIHKISYTKEADGGIEKHETNEVYTIKYILKDRVALYCRESLGDLEGGSQRSTPLAQQETYFVTQDKLVDYSPMLNRATINWGFLATIELQRLNYITDPRAVAMSAISLPMIIRGEFPGITSVEIEMSSEGDPAGVVKIHVSIEQGDMAIAITFLLDVKKGYLPISSMMDAHGTNDLQLSQSTEHEYTLKAVGEENIWIPIKTASRMVQSGFGSEYVFVTETVVEEVAYNTGLTLADLELVLPDGTKVRDETAGGVEYTIGTDKEAVSELLEEIAPEVEEASAAEVVREAVETADESPEEVDENVEPKTKDAAETVPVDGPQDEDEKSRFPLLIAIVLIVLIVLVPILAIRRRKSRRAGSHPAINGKVQ